MNYPNKIKKDNNYIEYKNRGMSLEEDINLSNTYYLTNDIALIYKKPTPIKATKVVFENNKKVIKHGYFETPSTTDYNGLYQGRYLDFEAKETKNKTSFPLSNIHSHQINHLKNVIKHHGVAFIIIRFTSLNQTYLLPGINFISYLTTKKTSSIPLAYFQSNAIIITESYQPRLDYIKIVDNLIKE